MNNNPIRPAVPLGPPAEQISQTAKLTWHADIQFWTLLSIQNSIDPWVGEVASAWTLLAENDPIPH